MLIAHSLGPFQLWGDAVLARRISWADLSEQTRAVHERFYGVFLPRNKESPSPQVRYFRPSTVDPNFDPLDHVRVSMYPVFCKTFSNEEIHRKGQIVIIDLRGPFKMSIMKFLDFCRISLPLM